ncbi:hypothetical protein V8E36_007497 [Tilletia maclaganii]
MLRELQASVRERRSLTPLLSLQIYLRCPLQCPERSPYQRGSRCKIKERNAAECLPLFLLPSVLPPSLQSPPFPSHPPLGPAAAAMARSISLFWLLGASLIAILAPTTATPSSKQYSGGPFDVDLLAARAGLPLGTRCEENGECASNHCGRNPDTDNRECIRGHTNETCTANDYCGSRNCKNGKCVESPLGGVCDSYSDCFGNQGGVFSNSLCPAGVCLGGNGLACSANKQCLSDFCSSSDGRCRRRPQGPNKACDVSAECLDGRCIDTATNPYCLFSDGSIDPSCDGTRHCARYALGKKCTATGDCERGLCTNGNCALGPNGSQCASDFQCTDKNAVCNPSSKKCYTPGNGTLYPQSHCSISAQCKYGGKCVDNLIRRDQYGVPLYPTGGDPNVKPPKRCAYIQLGKATCRYSRDCETGLCKNGTCVLGSDGDSCIYHTNCKVACTRKGKCFSPTAGSNLPRYEGATNRNQCASDRLTLDYVLRPVLDSATNETHRYKDTFCAKAF